MTETEALNIVKVEVDKTIRGYSIDVIGRKYQGMSIYVATIGVILKDDVIQPQTLIDLYNKIKNESLDMEVLGTSKEIRDLKYEILTLEVNITIGE